MSEQKKSVPTMAWHPKTGESQVFNHPDEVPSGWLDKHPGEAKEEKTSEGAKGDATLPMTREEIVSALKAGEITFKGNAKTGDLYAVLEAAVREHLTANSVEIPEGADVPALLALANPK